MESITELQKYIFDKGTEHRKYYRNFYNKLKDCPFKEVYHLVEVLKCMAENGCSYNEIAFYNKIQMVQVKGIDLYLFRYPGIKIICSLSQKRL